MQPNDSHDSSLNCQHDYAPNKRQREFERYRKLVQATPLPLIISKNLKGRSRVAVRSVRDLETYVTFIDKLCHKFHCFYGHKKVSH